jgi:DNA-binding FadR family transcriptional regulator
MSSISGVSSVTANPYQPINSNGANPLMKSLQAVSRAVQSGDLSKAQSAVATFQKQVQGNSQASANQPFGNNSQANSAYQGLVTSVQSGNLSAAQQALSSLKTDLKTAKATSSSVPSQPSAPRQPSAPSQTSSGQSTAALQGVSSALQSGNLSSALSALGSIQTSAFGSNSEANSAYQSLVTALQSGNSSAAQQAFAVLEAALS